MKKEIDTILPFISMWGFMISGLIVYKLWQILLLYSCALFCLLVHWQQYKKL